MKKFDIESIRERMRTSLRSKTSWASIILYSTTLRIIDIVAEALSETNREGEYLTRESKHSLAQNRSSLTAQAIPMGYTPFRKKGAVGQVKLALDEIAFSDLYYATKTYNEDDTVFYADDGLFYISTVDGNVNPPTGVGWTVLDLSPTSPIAVPRFTIFSSEDYQYTTIDELSVLNTDDQFIFVDVVQGIPRSQNFTAQGLPFETFVVDNDSIENNVFILTVNGVQWEPVQNIKTAEATDQVYQVINALDFTNIMIQFGNGITGKKLLNGDAVVFRYVETSGIDGNVYTVGEVNTVESTLRDGNGDIADVVVTNMAQYDISVDPPIIEDYGYLDGGSEVEDIESIRVNSVNTFQTGQRAVTKTDYITILKTFPQIYRVTVWGEYEIYLDNRTTPGYEHFISAEENLIHISAYTQSGSQITLAVQDQIRAFLNDVKAPTDIPTFDEVSFVYMVIDTKAYTSNLSATLSSVKNAIITELNTDYGILNSDFRRNIYESDLKRFIDEVQNVSYHDTNVEIYSIFDFEAGTQNVSIEAPIVPIEPTTVTVWVREKETTTWTQIASTLSNGNFSPIGSASVSGSINYNTGVGVFTYDNGPLDTSNYEVKVQYTLVDANISLQKRNQVVVLNPSDLSVTVNYLIQS